MTKIYAIIVAAFLIFGGGYYINDKLNELNELRDRLELIEKMEIQEQKHLDREAERQKVLEELEETKGRIFDESVKDTSDSGSTFGASRVRRLNEIR